MGVGKGVRVVGKGRMQRKILREKAACPPPEPASLFLLLLSCFVLPVEAQKYKMKVKDYSSHVCVCHAGRREGTRGWSYAISLPTCLVQPCVPEGDCPCPPKICKVRNAA